jgi:hypothetical protein
VSRVIRVLAVVGLLMGAACGSEESPEAQGTPQPQATASATTADSGTSMTTTGSCVEQYSIENLKHRTFAFDGTIKSIEPDPADGPDKVTFTVGEWFKGGQEDAATKQAYGFGGGMTSAGGNAHAVGERLLVAGDDRFIWECGFTQAYQESTAQEWKSALSAGS